MQQAILDALRSGDPASALTTAREMVARQPQDAIAHRLLALSLRANGENEAALAAIDQAIALAPDEPALHLERAGLLLDQRQLDEARAALAHTTGLDPNQFPAYIMQAHLALARGDVEEAERLTRTAARIAPEHPLVAALEGMLALRRGDADRALKILAPASERAPDEPQLRHALGLAYLAKGHHAFAEQAFRGLLERDPGSLPLRTLLAGTIRRQGRPAEAADELAPVLEREPVSPSLQRLVGELELEAGRNDRALPPLRAAFAARPDDRRTVLAIVEAWRRLDAADDARNTLDAALATHAQSSDLWRARLLFEEFAGDTARDIVGRWQQAMPDHIPALEAMIAIHDRAGEEQQAESLVARIIELEPGHTQAELRHVDRLSQHDPDAAVERVESLIDKASDAGVKRSLRSVLGRCQDAAGQYGPAVATWAGLHSDAAPQRLPLPPVTPASAADAWPPLAARDPAAPSQMLLWGAPGSLVERLAVVLQQARLPLLGDRYSAQPPDDLFQRFDSVPALAGGDANPAVLVTRWRSQLPARAGRDIGTAMDWLLFWDNAFLAALRPHAPEAMLLAAIRDPRDMLMAWLAYGSPAPFAIEDPQTAARWLAAVLGQLADLAEQDLFPHRVVKLDEIAGDPGALTQVLANAVGIEIPVPPVQSFGASSLPAGHWRRYADVLADAFAELAPVAARLGYPEA